MMVITRVHCPFPPRWFRLLDADAEGALTCLYEAPNPAAFTRFLQINGRNRRGDRFISDADGSQGVYYSDNARELGPGSCGGSLGLLGAALCPDLLSHPVLPHAQKRLNDLRYRPLRATRAEMKSS